MTMDHHQLSSSITPAPPSAFPHKQFVEIQDDDILCGRGMQCASHPGNLYFRQVIRDHALEYAAITIKSEKTKVVRKIYQLCVERGGRFLKKDPATGQWYDAGLKSAKDKIGHGFRDLKAFMEVEHTNGTNGRNAAGAFESMDVQPRKRMSRRHSAPTVSSLSFADIAAAARQVAEEFEAAGGDDVVDQPSVPVQPQQTVQQYVQPLAAPSIALPPEEPLPRRRAPRRASLNHYTNYEQPLADHYQRYSHTLQSFEMDFDDAVNSVEDVNIENMDPLDLDDSFNFDEAQNFQVPETPSRQEMPQQQVQVANIPYSVEPTPIHLMSQTPQNLASNVVQENDGVGGMVTDPLLELMALGETEEQQQAQAYMKVNAV